VSYETVRQWCGKFGPDYARRLKRRQGRLGDTWFLDEVFVTVNGQRQYLWRVQAKMRRADPTIRRLSPRPTP
jgi:putative transposase